MTEHDTVSDALNLTSELPRVCMISTHGYVAADPPLGAADTGGQVVFVLELSKKLADLGYQVDIWTRRFEDQPQMDILNERVRIIRMPCGGPGFLSKEYLYKALPEWGENALRFIRCHGIQYSFINSHYWDAGLAGQTLSEVLGCPHLHTPHSLGVWKKNQMEKDFPDDRASFEEKYNFSVRIREETALYADCDMVIATTPIQLEMLADDYDMPVARTRMIPPGYDDNRFYAVSEASRQSIRRRLGFRGPTVLALGRLAENKGYDLLISAFALVAERVSASRLHLAVGGQKMGDSEEQLLTKLKALARSLGLEDRIDFAGYVSDDDLSDYYRAADLFVLSSRYEPFGMTAIEAMACGTPTVVTTHGGLYRTITFGRHGLFADPFDREDLGICMVKPFKHVRLWKRLSRMGAHKARSLFTWTGIAQQLVHIVEERSVKAFSLDDNEWDEPWNDGE
ncbi:MAG: glycosyltransferase family 1 protein [Terrimicrobiaceae bacterium]